VIGTSLGEECLSAFEMFIGRVRSDRNYSFVGGYASGCSVSNVNFKIKYCLDLLISGRIDIRVNRMRWWRQIRRMTATMRKTSYMKKYAKKVFEIHSWTSGDEDRRIGRCSVMLTIIIMTTGKMNNTNI